MAGLRTAKTHNVEVQGNRTFNDSTQTPTSAAARTRITPTPAPIASATRESRSSTISVAGQRTVADPPPRKLQPGVVRVEVENEGGKNFNPPKKPIHEWPVRNRSEPRLEKLASRPTPPDQRALAKEAGAESRLTPLKTNKPVSDSDDEKKNRAERIVHHHRVVEQKLETVVIREKPGPIESKRRVEWSSHPVAQNISPPAAQNIESSRARSMFEPSPITPLIAARPDPPPINRTEIQPQPTVQVTIGRLEIRAVQSSARPAKPQAKTPVMNLDDYLRQRSQGATR